MASVAAIVALASALLAPAALRAAPATAADATPLGELEDVLAQPVYGSSRSAGAAKHEQDLASSPAAVVVRTGGEIRAQGYRTLAEVLDSMPGIHVQTDRVYVYGGLRGVNRPGDFTSRLLLLIDGVRVNDSLYDAAPIGREFPLDVGLIDRVEYIPGPGSALYGSSAVLGVVNVITRSASQLPGWAATAEVGSAASRKAGLTWGGELGGGRTLLGLSSETRPGGDLYFPAYDSAATNHGIAEHRDGEKASSVFIKSHWTDISVDAAVSERIKDVPTASYGARFDAPNRWTDRYAFANVSLDRRFDEHHEVHARLGAQSYQFRSRTTSGTLDAPSFGTEEDNATAITGELRYAWLGWAGHRPMIGFEFQRNPRQSIHLADVSPEYQDLTDIHTRSERHAFFAGDEWQVLPSLMLNLGLRIDRRTDGASTTTPRLAAIWSPGPAWTVKWMQGSAFREPNVYERFYADDTQRANPGLKVETMESRELAVSWRPDANWSFDSSLYTYRIHDLVELMAEDDGLNQFGNRGEVRSHGIELTATHVFNDGAQLRLSGSHQRAVDALSGQRLSGSPETLVQLMWTTPGPWAGSRFGFNASHVSSRLTLAGERLPSYVQGSLNLMHAPAGQHWSVGLAIYNLTNQHHAEPVGPENIEDAVVQDGRELRLQFGWTF